MLEVNSDNNECTSFKNNSSTNSLRKLVKNPRNIKNDCSSSNNEKKEE